MTLALREVPRDNRDLMRYLQPLIWSWMGVAGKGVPLTNTSVSSATKYSVDAANAGTGGLALRAVGGANTFTVNTAGITASSLTVTGTFTAVNLAATGNLTVDGNTTLGNAVGDTTTISGDATVGRDLTVSDDLIVTDDATINGDLSVQGALDVDGASSLSTTTVTGAGGGDSQALKVQHGSGDGVISLGATDSATPNLIVSNNAGTQIARITNEGVLLPGTLTSVPASAEDGDVVCDDLFVWDSASNYRRISANGSALQISNNGDSGTHLTIDSTGLLTVNMLQVDDSINISNDLEVDSNALFRGDVDILDDVTIGSDLLVSGTATFSNAPNFADGSGSGFTEDTWSGYIEIQHASSTKYVPYLSSAP